jgi:transposase
MAFLRKENKKGKTYLSICESYRDINGKTNRRVLHNLGNLEYLGEESLQRIAKQLLSLTHTEFQEVETEELERVNYGYVMVLSMLLQTYQLSDFFRRKSRQHKLSYQLIHPILLMLCDRLNDPISKLGSHRVQTEYFGLASIGLHHLYRSLDYLSLYNDVIQTQIYQHNRNLFNYELDVVFFDVTTFYFDSDVVKEGELRQFGFGKDGKVGKTQIVFSLLIDKQKMPIGFEIFNGKQFEGHTFENALKTLKEKFAIGKVIVVADSGMMSKKNIAYFEQEGMAQTYEYIVGDRLKVLPHKIKEKLTHRENYTTTIEVGQTGEESPLKICVIEHENKKIIGTWSAKREAKDKKDRETRVAKAKQLLQTPDQLKKKAQNYYLKTTNNIDYELDQRRILEDAKYDGYKAISTNTKEISMEMVLEQYRYLYQIEHSFRTFKSFLEARPMFHWTDERIKGHLVMCYIALVMLRYMEQKTGLTENEIRKSLSKMQMSKVKSGNNTFWLRAKQTPQIEKFIKDLNLKPLPNTISEVAIKNYIPDVL